MITLLLTVIAMFIIANMIIGIGLICIYLLYIATVYIISKIGGSAWDTIWKIMAAVHSTFAFAAMTAKTRRVNVALMENTGKDCKNTGNITLIIEYL